MKLDRSKPILYLITPGAGTEATTPHSPEFKQILSQVSAAVAAGISLIQLREKRLSARVLFELTERAVSITRGSATRLLVNDRADIAAGAQADGVHLTSQSIDPRTIRRTFGTDFLLGASTHSLVEVQAAREGGADFVVFGPVFTTAAKEKYGAPVGIGELRHVSESLRPFPVIALGGVNAQNAPSCLQAGATGLAGISIFQDPQRLSAIVATLRQ
jgi:thiamine-phosphate pyrophosphorylase